MYQCYDDAKGDYMYLLSDLDTKVLLYASYQWLLTGGVQHPFLDGRLEARARVNEYCMETSVYW